MFKPRLTKTESGWLDKDGVKLYSISASGQQVDFHFFLAHLQELKQRKVREWSAIPAFAIFHDGVSAKYLVLVAWGNDNEMFTWVSVNDGSAWVEDYERYSYCLWDLEVMWEERNIYIETMYSGLQDLDAYRASRPARWIASNDEE